MLVCEGFRQAFAGALEGLVGAAPLCYFVEEPAPGRAFGGWFCLPSHLLRASAWGAGGHRMGTSGSLVETDAAEGQTDVHVPAERIRRHFVGQSEYEPERLRGSTKEGFDEGFQRVPTGILALCEGRVGTIQAGEVESKGLTLG